MTTNRSRLLSVLVALLLVLVTLPTSTAVVHAAPPGAPRVTLIGDSTMAAMRWATYDNDDPDTLANNDIRGIISDSYDLVFDAESCRRLVGTSCRGREGYTPVSVLPLMRGRLNGIMGSTLVMMAGYDETWIDSGVDAVMAEAERQGIQHVIWLTFRESTSYTLPDPAHTPASQLYAAHNQALANATARHPSLSLLDWNTIGGAHPEWFYSDGIHLTPAGAVGLAQTIKARLDTVAVSPRCNPATDKTGVPSIVGGTPIETPPGDSGYVPRPPLRVLDTRDPALGGEHGMLGAQRSVTIDVSTAVPADATSAVMTVTAADPCAAGFLTVYACGVTPGTSNVNYEVGRNTAGLVVSAIDAGRVCIHSYATTDVVVDVIGAFVPGSGQPFHPIDPTRWVDTRAVEPALLEQPKGIQTTGSDFTVPIRGVGGIPATATAAWINLTIADPTAPTVLLAYPGPCTGAPNASTVNARPARSAASSAIVGLGVDGSICVHTLVGSAGAVVDVAGWFGPGDGGLLYRQHVPTRLYDSRTLSPVPPSSAVQVPLPAPGVLNVTAAESTALGYLTARPCGSPQASSLVNTAPGENTANLTAVAPSAGGALCISPYSPTHVVVDSFGDLVPAPLG